MTPSMAMYMEGSNSEVPRGGPAWRGVCEMAPGRLLVKDTITLGLRSGVSGARFQDSGLPARDVSSIREKRKFVFLVHVRLPLAIPRRGNNMPSKVFFGTARQARLEAKETLPAKLDLILEQLHLRDRVNKETVVIKMHTGNNMVYSTIHPVFVRRVVQAIKDGGGKPIVVDLNWDTEGAEARGYASEVIGCPVYPAAGPDEKYFYEHERPYKSIRAWKVAGLVQDSSFLVNFAHVKGHPSCGFGAAFKNLALGCLAGKSRGAMHDAMHYDQYWFPEKCPDKSLLPQIIAACPFDAVVEDKEDPGNLHLHMEQCNQCGRCLKVAPEGSLKIQPENFHTFQEACAIAVDIVLSTFAPD